MCTHTETPRLLSPASAAFPPRLRVAVSTLQLSSPPQPALPTVFPAPRPRPSKRPRSVPGLPTVTHTPVQSPLQTLFSPLHNTSGLHPTLVSRPPPPGPEPHNQGPHPGRLKTTAVCSHPALGAGSPKSRGLQGRAPSGGSRGGAFLPLQASGGPSAALRTPCLDLEPPIGPG